MAFYHFIMLDVVFNFQLSHLKVIPLFVLSIWILPLLSAHLSAVDAAFKPACGAFVLVMLIACAFSFWVPGFTEHRPRPTNLVYMEQHGTDKAHWLMETSYSVAPDRQYLSAAGFPEEREEILKYYVYPVRSFVKPAIKQNLPAPTLNVLSIAETDDEKIIELRVASNREAFQLSLAFDNKALVNEVKVNGVYVKHERNFIPIAVGPGGSSHVVTLSVKAKEALEMTVFDMAPLTDTEGQRLLRLRPSRVQPLDNGDRNTLFISI